MDSYPSQPSILPVATRKYELANDYTFTFHGHRVTIPAGFTYDGASVPRFLWWFIPPDGPHRAAALIHDYLYMNKGVVAHLLISRKQTDDLFLAHLKDSGIKPYKTKMMYWAVRLGGGFLWKPKHTISKIKTQ